MKFTPANSRILAELGARTGLGDRFYQGPIIVVCNNRADLADTIRAIKATGLVSDITKDATDDYMHVTMSFGDGGQMLLAINREQVCRKIETGTETVEIPDPDAPKVKVTRPVYEWECDPILKDVRDA